MPKKKEFRIGDRVRINKPGSVLHGNQGTVIELFSWSKRSYGVEVDDACTLHFHQKELDPVS